MLDCSWPAKQHMPTDGVPPLPQYDSASIQQMAGRAGRKGFDTEGKVIVLTEDTNVDMYRKIMVKLSGIITARTQPPATIFCCPTVICNPISGVLYT